MKNTFNHEDIARLARHIWQLEGCQSGRDEENWLKAEQLLRLAAQPESGRTTNAKTKSNGALTKEKKAQPAARGARQFQQART